MERTFGGRLRRRQLPKVQGQPALIPCRCILLDNAPLSGTIDQSERLRNQSRGALGILRGEQPAHRANLVTKA